MTPWLKLVQQQKDQNTPRPPDPPDNDDMEARLTRLEAALPTLATKADVADVRGDIKGWMLATVLAVIGTLLAALFGIAQLMKPQPQAAAQHPIIINVPGAVQAPAPATSAPR